MGMLDNLAVTRHWLLECLAGPASAQGAKDD